MIRDLFARPFVHGIALLLLCGLLASCGRLDITVVDPTATAVSTPSASTTTTPNLNTTATAQPTATRTGSQIRATRTANEAIMRHAEETARALHRTPDLSAIPPTPDGPTPVRLHTGIHTGCAGSSESSYMTFENCWVDVLNGEYVWVEAGSADTSTGRIGVITYTLNFSYESAEKYYDTPQAKGAVKIIAVTGAHVILQYPDSSTVAFNLDTRTWEDSSTFPSPSPTALPTSTPATTPTSPTGGSNSSPPTSMLDISPHRLLASSPPRLK